jgi:plastocyanin
MKRLVGIAALLAITTALGFGPAGAAETKVRVSREENKPQKVEIKVGDEVSWVNGTGGMAHVEFADTGLAFYIGGKEGKVKFEKAGTYEYTVHISGVKSHAHTGTIVVK